MGLFLKMMGIGLALWGIAAIANDGAEEKRRKNTTCSFNGKISKEEFELIVKHSGKRIRRLVSLYAQDAIVFGTVRSQSGLSVWNFQIDFNDYGKLTGNYWIFTDNNDSDIPQIVADEIKTQIIEYPRYRGSYFDNELHHQGQNFWERAGVCCSRCGQKNYDSKFCIYCGYPLYGRTL